MILATTVNIKFDRGKKSKINIQLFTFVVVQTFLYCHNIGMYRVSQDTWQLVNSFECLLPPTVLDIKDLLQFVSLKKCLTHIYFTLKLILLYYELWLLYNILLMSLVLNTLTNCGRRHSKLFTNCHVSWDTNGENQRRIQGRGV